MVAAQLAINIEVGVQIPLGLYIYIGRKVLRDFDFSGVPSQLIYYGYIDLTHPTCICWWKDKTVSKRIDSYDEAEKVKSLKLHLGYSLWVTLVIYIYIY